MLKKINSVWTFDIIKTLITLKSRRHSQARRCGTIANFTHLWELREGRRDLFSNYVAHQVCEPLSFCFLNTHHALCLLKYGFFLLRHQCSCGCIKTNTVRMFSRPALGLLLQGDLRSYAMVAHSCAVASRSMSASSLTSSRSEYRLGALLWLYSRSSLESLAFWLAFSRACWLASSARRTTSWTSWLRPCACCCGGSELRCGWLLTTSSLRQSAWKGVDWTEMRTCGAERGRSLEVLQARFSSH